jgi:hypothetical protein
MSYCAKCNGTGRTFERVSESCYTCSGTGRRGSSNDSCLFCGGSGTKTTDKFITCNHCFGNSTKPSNTTAENFTSDRRSGCCSLKGCLVIVLIYLVINFLWALFANYDLISELLEAMNEYFGK